MKNLTIWSISSSLFCSLAVSDCAYETMKGPILAAAGNPAAVQHSLVDMASRMGLAETEIIPTAAPAVSGTPVAALTATEEELAPLADWLLREGAKETLEAPFTKAIGLGAAEIEVWKKVYEGKTDKNLSIAVASENGKDILLSRQKADRSGLLWLTSRNGTLRATAIVTNATDIKIVDNEPYLKGFEKQKKYFLGRAGGNRNGVAAAGSASDSSALQN